MGLLHLCVSFLVINWPNRLVTAINAGSKNNHQLTDCSGRDVSTSCQPANACLMERISSSDSCNKFRTVSPSIFIRNSEGT